MCGRYTLTCRPDVVAEEFRLEAIPAFHPRYNVAPSQGVACVRTRLQVWKREAVTLRWGFIPSWAGDPAIGMKLIQCQGGNRGGKAILSKAVSRTSLSGAGGRLL